MGKLYRRKPGGTWWGEWRDRTGARFQRSLKTNDKAVARERLHAAEMGAPSAGSSHRLSEALTYLVDVACADKAPGTRVMYEQKGRNLLRLLGDVELGKFTRDGVARYVQARLGEIVIATGKPTSPSTVAKELITLRRALGEARERGLFMRAPTDVLPRFKAKAKPRDRHLSAAEFEALFAAIAVKRRLWVALAALGGMRLSEVERITWEHVDVAEGRMRVPGTKTAGSWRLVPISPPLRTILEIVPEAARRGPIAGRWHNARRDLRDAIARANKRAANSAAEAGAPPPPVIERATPNDLRRTFASWLKQAGVDSAVVASLLGNASTKMVDLVYGRLDEATKRRALDTLPARPTPSPPALPEPATEDDRPYVCPGCHAVAPERCAPGCIDAEIEAELQQREYQPSDEDE